MAKLIYKLRESIRFEKILKYLMIIFLFGYVFSIPAFSNRTSLNLITYALMSLFGATTIFYCIVYRGFKLHPVSFILPAFALFAFIGTAIYSRDFRGWFSLIILSLSLIIFIYSFSSLKDRYLILRVISLAFFLFTLYFIYVYRNEFFSLKNFGKGDFRLGYIFDNPNAIASYMVISFASCLSTILFSKKKFDYFLLIPLFCTLLVGVSTGSRTFIIAILVFLIILLFFKFKKHKLVYFIVLGLLIAIFGIVISLPFMETIRLRFLHFFETLFGTGEKADSSSVTRLLWLKYGFFLGSKNILIGYGFEGFAKYSGIGTYTHSNISEVFCNFGIIGMLLFYSPLIVCLVKSIKEKRINLSLVIPFFVYYMLVSFSNVFYYNKTYYIMVALITFCSFEEGIERSTYKSPVKLNKILIACDSMNAGGAERVISILSNNFVKNDLEVNILMISNHECKSFYELDEKVRLSCLCENSEGKVRTLKRLKMLRNYIKKYDPSVIVSFLPHVSVYTYFANLGLNVHHIVSERSNPKKNPTNKFLRIIKKFCFKNSDGGVYQSEDAMNFFGTKGKYKGVIIANPILFSSINKVDYNHSNKTFVYAGRLTVEKNPMLLVEAFNKAVKKDTDLKLKIYGDGPLKDELSALINKYSLSENICLCGLNLNWLSESINDTGFVLSSNYEGMPNALIEAMVAGLPCIATKCDGGVVTALIENNKNGFIVDCNDADALADKILEVSQMNEKAKEMCLLNKDLKDKFNGKYIANTWQHYLQKVLENNYAK